MGRPHAAALALIVACSGAIAAADPATSRTAIRPAALGIVALLPLDTTPALELYGQPVASEVARALVAGGYDVVVVGDKAAVPDGAKLIVDGTIGAGKGDTVVVSLRVRDPRRGKTLDTVTADPEPLEHIDRIAAQLSAHLLPSVKAQLAALAAEHARIAATRTEAAHDESPLPASTTSDVAPLELPPPTPYVLATGGTAAPLLQTALATAVDRWAARAGRASIRLTADQLTAQTAAHTIAAHRADVGLALEVIGFDGQPGVVPLARAHVHVVIADATHTLFDRVIVTDTIVGDKHMNDDAFAARVADAVIDILDPQVRRIVPAWRTR